MFSKRHKVNPISTATPPQAPITPAECWTEEPHTNELERLRAHKQHVAAVTDECQQRLQELARQEHTLSQLSLLGESTLVALRSTIATLMDPTSPAEQKARAWQAIEGWSAVHKTHT
eukprot:NODE_6576_length_521_cov_13.751269_g6411_i0.p1 GENE.NODE_6576_length_521_cov_13.751269_g6411_i0~~NODE_6576_length_521_cov_13.751269_g6411_i0.p1  ORF type:complete len:117 (+),score=17.01 NODE_6576_length_521_cov_13.751269_g6411_i0:37-387(+)